MSEADSGALEKQSLKEIADTLKKICTILESMDKKLGELEHIREGINIGLGRVSRKKVS